MSDVVTRIFISTEAPTSFEVRAAGAQGKLSN